MRRLLAVALACLVAGCGDRAPTNLAPESPAIEASSATIEKKKRDPELPKYPPGCISACKTEGQAGKEECLRTGGNKAFCEDYWGNYWQQCAFERCSP